MPPDRALARLNGLGGYVQIFDRKYRLFGLINLIDLIVILAVLVGAFAVYRLLSRDKTAGSASAGEDIAYTVLCPAQRGIPADQIKVGDMMYKVTGKAVGKVTGVRETPTMGEFWNVQTQRLQTYQSTITSDIWIDAVAKGTPSQTGFAVGDLVLHGGQPFPIMTSTFECDTASITTMTVVGQ